MWAFFKNKEIPYNLRRGPVLSIPPASSTTYGTNSIHFRGSLIWNRLPNFIKSSNSIIQFKNNIKLIGNIDCGCLICRWYLSSRHRGVEKMLIYMLFHRLWPGNTNKSTFFQPPVKIEIEIVLFMCCWFLLALGYFCIPTLNKVINK